MPALRRLASRESVDLSPTGLGDSFKQRTFLRTEGRANELDAVLSGRVDGDVVPDAEGAGLVALQSPHLSTLQTIQIMELLSSPSASSLQNRLMPAERAALAQLVAQAASQAAEFADLNAQFHRASVTPEVRTGYLVPPHSPSLAPSAFNMTANSSESAVSRARPDPVATLTGGFPATTSPNGQQRELRPRVRLITVGDESAREACAAAEVPVMAGGSGGSSVQNVPMVTGPSEIETLAAAIVTATDAADSEGEADGALHSSTGFDGIGVQVRDRAPLPSTANIATGVVLPSRARSPSQRGSASHLLSGPSQSGSGSSGQVSDPPLLPPVRPVHDRRLSGQSSQRYSQGGAVSPGSKMYRDASSRTNANFEEHHQVYLSRFMTDGVVNFDMLIHEMESLRTDRDRVEKLRRLMIVDFETLHAEFDETCHNLLLASKALTSLQEEKDSLLRDHAELECDFMEYIEEKDRFAEQANAQVSALRDERRDNIQLIERLEAELNEHTPELEALRRELAAKKAAMDALEQQLQALDSASARQRDEFHSELVHAHDSLVTAGDENEKLRIELSHLREDLARTRAHSVAAAEDVRELDDLMLSAFMHIDDLYRLRSVPRRAHGTSSPHSPEAALSSADASPAARLLSLSSQADPGSTQLANCPGNAADRVRFSPRADPAPISPSARAHFLVDVQELDPSSPGISRRGRMNSLASMASQRNAGRSSRSLAEELFEARSASDSSSSGSSSASHSPHSRRSHNVSQRSSLSINQPRARRSSSYSNSVPAVPPFLEAAVPPFAAGVLRSARVLANQQPRDAADVPRGGPLQLPVSGLQSSAGPATHRSHVIFPGGTSPSPSCSSSDSASVASAGACPTALQAQQYAHARGRRSRGLSPQARGSKATLAPALAASETPSPRALAVSALSGASGSPASRAPPVLVVSEPRPLTPSEPSPATGPVVGWRSSSQPVSPSTDRCLVSVEELESLIYCRQRVVELRRQVEFTLLRDEASVTEARDYRNKIIELLELTLCRADRSNDRAIAERALTRLRADIQRMRELGSELAGFDEIIARAQEQEAALMERLRRFDELDAQAVAAEPGLAPTSRAHAELQRLREDVATSARELATATLRAERAEMACEDYRGRLHTWTGREAEGAPEYLSAQFNSLDLSDRSSNEKAALRAFEIMQAEARSYKLRSTDLQAELADARSKLTAALHGVSCASPPVASGLCLRCRQPRHATAAGLSEEDECAETEESPPLSTDSAAVELAAALERPEGHCIVPLLPADDTLDAKVRDLVDDMLEGSHTDGDAEAPPPTGGAALQCSSNVTSIFDANAPEYSSQPQSDGGDAQRSMSASLGAAVGAAEPRVSPAASENCDWAHARMHVNATHTQKTVFVHGDAAETNPHNTESNQNSKRLGTATRQPAPATAEAVPETTRTQPCVVVFDSGAGPQSDEAVMSGARDRIARLIRNETRALPAGSHVVVVAVSPSRPLAPTPGCSGNRCEPTSLPRALSLSPPPRLSTTVPATSAAAGETATDLAHAARHAIESFLRKHQGPKAATTTVSVGQLQFAGTVPGGAHALSTSSPSYGPPGPPDGVQPPLSPPPRLPRANPHSVATATASPKPVSVTVRRRVYKPEPYLTRPSSFRVADSRAGDAARSGCWSPVAHAGVSPTALGLRPTAHLRLTRLHSDSGSDSAEHAQHAAPLEKSPRAAYQAAARAALTAPGLRPLSTAGIAAGAVVIAKGSTLQKRRAGLTSSVSASVASSDAVAPFSRVISTVGRLAVAAKEGAKSSRADAGTRHTVRMKDRN